MWSAGEVALTRSNPWGESELNGIDSPTPHLGNHGNEPALAFFAVDGMTMSLMPVRRCLEPAFFLGLTSHLQKPKTNR